MASPFDAGVKGIDAVKTEDGTMPATFEQAGESIIQVFDSAGNAISGSLTGGFGKAADSVKTQVNSLQNHLNANPLDVVINLNNDAFRRQFAELGLQRDTAGALP